MANIVYDYDKSSCNCYTQTMQVNNTNTNTEKEGYPTNMSVRNCEFPKYFEDKPFRQVTGPRKKSGITYLNPDVLTQKYAKDFVKIKGGVNCCPSVQYYSSDPRLISSSHNGQVQTLNTPPITGDLPLNKILDDKGLDNYGQNYNDYSSINAGQIMYYNDKSIEDPFFNPNFVTTAKTTAINYKDPMGSIKPQYTRSPLKALRHVGPTRNNYDGCLSWIQDSTGFREDIMALQMKKGNQQKYSSRWFPDVN
uniref:Uncharacterized protein n=1 Tax=viral metagenome TaxID=1070528 RepID=A0A6C0LWS5_9ZZZZ